MPVKTSPPRPTTQPSRMPVKTSPPRPQRPPSKAPQSQQRQAPSQSNEEELLPLPVVLPLSSQPPPVPTRSKKSLEWAVFDNLTLEDLQNFANIYKTKSSTELNSIFMDRCKKTDQNNPQCKYDVDLLTNIVYNMARMKTTPDYSKLPPKLKAKVLENIKSQKNNSTPDYSKLPPKLRAKVLENIKSQKAPTLKPSVKSKEESLVTASISNQLNTLINKIATCEDDALQEKNPSKMKQKLNNVKKEMNNYMKILSKSLRDLNKYSPDLLPKYKQANSEYILLSKYIDVYDKFLTQLILLKTGAEIFVSKPEYIHEKALNDIINAYVKFVELNYSIPESFRILNYVDTTPIKSLYGIHNFLYDKKVQKSIARFGMIK